MLGEKIRRTASTARRIYFIHPTIFTLPSLAAAPVFTTEQCQHGKQLQASQEHSQRQRQLSHTGNTGIVTRSTELPNAGPTLEIQEPRQKRPRLHPHRLSKAASSK